jgi:hypothetical protein
MVKFSLSNVNLVDNRLINSSPDVLFHNLVETLDFRNTVHAALTVFTYNNENFSYDYNSQIELPEAEKNFIESMRSEILKKEINEENIKNLLNNNNIDEVLKTRINNALQKHEENLNEIDQTTRTKKILIEGLTKEKDKKGLIELFKKPCGNSADGALYIKKITQAGINKIDNNEEKLKQYSSLKNSKFSNLWMLQYNKNYEEISNTLSGSVIQKQHGKDYKNRVIEDQNNNANQKKKYLLTKFIPNVIDIQNFQARKIISDENNEIDNKSLIKTFLSFYLLNNDDFGLNGGNDIFLQKNGKKVKFYGIDFGFNSVNNSKLKDFIEVENQQNIKEFLKTFIKKRILMDQIEQNYLNYNDYIFPENFLDEKKEVIFAMRYAIGSSLLKNNFFEKDDMNLGYKLYDMTLENIFNEEYIQSCKKFNFYPELLNQEVKGIIGEEDVDLLKDCLFRLTLLKKVYQMYKNADIEEVGRLREAFKCNSGFSSLAKRILLCEIYNNLIEKIEKIPDAEFQEALNEIVSQKELFNKIDNLDNLDNDHGDLNNNPNNNVESNKKDGKSNLSLTLLKAICILTPLLSSIITFSISLDAKKSISDDKLIDFFKIPKDGFAKSDFMIVIGVVLLAICVVALLVSFKDKISNCFEYLRSNCYKGSEDVPHARSSFKRG